MPGLIAAGIVHRERAVSTDCLIRGARAADLAERDAARVGGSQTAPDIVVASGVGARVIEPIADGGIANVKYPDIGSGNRGGV